MAYNSQVVLNDPNNAGGSSDAILVFDLQQALNQWSRYIRGTGTLTVQLNIAEDSVGRADGGPTSSYYVGTSNGLNIFGPSSLYELTYGQHVNGTTSDITVTLSPSYFQNLDLSQAMGYFATPAANKFNPVVIFMHELMHGFGMTSYRDQAGNLPGAYESTFDTHTQVNPGVSAFYVGANGEAAEGGPVRITTSSTTQNYSHFGDTMSDINKTPSTVQDPLTLDMMNGVVAFFGYRWQVSQLDLGVLKDLGYSLINPAISDTDANGDGSSDIFLQNASGTIIDWLTQNGTYQSYNTIGNASGYNSVGHSDFNGDGTTDVLLENGSGNIIDWIMQNGHYAGWNEVGNLAGSGYAMAGTGDFNGDGSSDVLFENGSGNVIDWTLQNGHYAGWNEVGNLAGSGYGIVGSGDFNGDGSTDVLLQNGSGNIIDWIMQNGHYAGWSEVGNSGVYGIIGTGDFNGDGSTDVLLENGNGNIINWILQNGHYAGWNEVGNPWTAGYSVVGTGDYDGSGTTDLLLENPNQNVIDWTMENGTYSGWHNIGNAAGYAVSRT